MSTAQDEQATTGATKEIKMLLPVWVKDPKDKYVLIPPGLLTQFPDGAWGFNVKAAGLQGLKVLEALPNQFIGAMEGFQYGDSGKETQLLVDTVPKETLREWGSRLRDCMCNGCINLRKHRPELFR